jgi:glycosyltransferase involved in cell wall biosynthesis
MTDTRPALRTLFVTGPGKPADAEIRRQVAEDRMPDAISAEDAIGAFYIDDRMMATLPGLRGQIMRRLPFRLGQLAEAALRGRDYDAVFTWGDIPTILFGALMRLWPRRPAHVALLVWPSKPKKAIPLRLTRRSIDRVIAPAPLQRRFLAERLGIPADRIVGTHWLVDAGYWRPIEREQDTICAVGQEMRDYATLVAALRGLPVPCHIAVGTTVFGTTSDHWWRDSLGGEGLPDTITVGPRSFDELRELYARSRFVVVPLIPSDNDNGITAIQEAMAMGRAVIATRTPGQVGVLEDGVNCVLVAPHDPAALREAIERLWNDPGLCARLGAAGRRFVEESNGLEPWTRMLERTVGEAVEMRVAAGRRRR